MNRIYTQDQWIQLGGTREFKFYGIDGKIDMSGKEQYVKFDEKITRQRLIEIEFALSDTMCDHHRKPLGILDILSALGGFEKNLSLLGFFFMTPISYHNYILKAIQKLFLVNTSDSKLINRRKNIKVVRKEKLAYDMLDQYPKAKQEEILMNRAPKFTTKQHVFLFINMMYPTWCCCRFAI